MKASFTSRMSLVAACLAVGLAAQAVAAVNVDFTNGGDLTGFSASGAGSWTLTAAGLENALPAPGDGYAVQSIQLIAVPTADTAQDFKVSTHFVVSSPAPNTSWGGFSVGVGLLSNSPGFPTWSGGADWFTASLNMPMAYGGPHAYAVDMGRADGMYGGSVASAPLAGVTAGGVYSLEVTGTHADGNLTLTTTLTDPAALVTQIQYITATPAGGGEYTYFGLMTSASNQAGGTVIFKDFGVGAVPEPATMGVLGLVSASLLARRRRLA